VVATGGNQRQIGSARKWRKQAKTVAAGCHRLPENGKEGVSGSSPEEGSAKTPEVGAFLFGRTCSSSNVRWVWSPLWSRQIRNPVP
jgi:hypothetical protein